MTDTINKQLANKLLNNYWNGDIPVDISFMVKKLGIELRRFTPKDNSIGKIETYQNSTTIFYNHNHGQIRNRFIVTHLLGKYLMNSSIQSHRIFPQNVSTKTTLQEDINANNFALDLLIPESALIAGVQNGYIVDVTNGAEQFAVSPLAMAKKLEKINFYDQLQVPSNTRNGSSLEEDFLEIAGAIITAKFGM